jgi:hypothetical protein
MTIRPRGSVARRVICRLPLGAGAHRSGTRRSEGDMVGHRDGADAWQCAEIADQRLHRPPRALGEEPRHRFAAAGPSNLLELRPLGGRQRTI